MVRSLIYPIGLPTSTVTLNEFDLHRASRLPVVQFANLNLYFITDVRALHRRIRAAATRAREHFLDSDAVIAEAVAAIAHPLLTQYHRQVTSRSPGAGLDLAYRIVTS